MERHNISTGTPWEPRIGYSRAVRIGSRVIVSGTTAVNERGEIVGVGNPYAQAMKILSSIEKVLIDAGAQLKDVVRTRIYVTNLDHWEQVGRAHGKIFGEIRPASTIIEVGRMVSKDMLVEIEAEAVILEDES